MKNALAERSCAPCRRGTPPLNETEIAPLLAQLDGWEAVEAHHLRKEFRFPDFRAALAFVNRIGELAEREDHHPDLELGWGRAAVTIWTHSVGGLSHNDFILAAKIDRL
jgi:4a-hydroxytetrahydrobiopterin dehydratase